MRNIMGHLVRSHVLTGGAVARSLARSQAARVLNAGTLVVVLARK